MTMALDSIALQELAGGLTPTQFEIEKAANQALQDWRRATKIKDTDPETATQYLISLYDQKDCMEDLGKRSNVLKAYDFIVDHIIVIDKASKPKNKPLFKLLASLRDLAHVGVSDVGVSPAKVQKYGTSKCLDAIALNAKTMQEKIDHCCAAISQDLRKERGFVLDKKDPRLFLLATVHEPIESALYLRELTEEFSFTPSSSPKIVLRRRYGILIKTLRVG